MKLPAFDYAAPSSVDEALRLLAAHPGAKALAGGQSLLPTMAFRLAAPPLLVDLRRIDALKRIEIDEKQTILGAGVRWRDLLDDPRLKTAQPLLVEAVPHVAHYQIRNRGTIGGSLAHLDPAAELPGIMALYEAQLAISSARGNRVVKIGDWSRGYMTPNLEADEILTSITWEAWPARHGHAFVEFARRRGDFAIVGVGCLLALDGRNVVQKAALALVGVAYGPVRLGAAERLLVGRTLDEKALEAASAEARKVEAKSDLYASGAYRQRLAGVLTARALKSAGERARG